MIDDIKRVLIHEEKIDQTGSQIIVKEKGE